MKVLLVLCGNVYCAPYLKLYINILNANHISYKILYWNKNNNEIFDDDKHIEYKSACFRRIDKIKGYIGFRSKIISEIKKNEIDYIIPLGSYSWVIIYDQLIRKFKGRYIFDVRDYSLERFKIYRKMETNMTKYSALNVISSEGYKEFLPVSDYMIAHNLPDLEGCKSVRTTYYRDDPIILGFIGVIRFMEQNKRIINYFKNDTRFKIMFIGTGADELREYCENQGITNVELRDTFNSKDTIDYYNKIDLILNLYGNHTPLLDYALSNKLYYAAALYKPILVCKDTYMEKISMKYGFGFVIEFDNGKSKNSLYEKYKQIKLEVLKTGCDEFIKNAVQEQAILEDKLNTLLKI